jgi:hypothetical protein
MSAVYSVESAAKLTTEIREIRVIRGKERQADRQRRV